MAWVAKQDGCYPHRVAPVYAAVHGSMHRCQPASTPTPTLLAYFHLNIRRPLPTAGRVLVRIIHLITQKTN